MKTGFFSLFTKAARTQAPNFDQTLLLGAVAQSSWAGAQNDVSRVNFRDSLLENIAGRAELTTSQAVGAVDVAMMDVMRKEGRGMVDMFNSARLCVKESADIIARTPAETLRQSAAEFRALSVSAKDRIAHAERAAITNSDRINGHPGFDY